MKRKIVAANWKMNTDIQTGRQLAVALNNGIAEGKLPDGVEVILGVPFTHLTMVTSTVDYKKFSTAAQDCAAFEQGAYTGEVSAAMIKSTGAQYVILGHSERRTYFGETDKDIATKIRICLKNNLKPIYCCGETLQQRESGDFKEVIKKQLHEGLFHVDDEDMQRTIVAYEPVWAIGTGLTATPEQAQEIHAYIRELISTTYSKLTGNAVPILYGGSCNAKNARELFSQPDINGGLIGGASLKHLDFFEIMNSF